MNQTNNIWALPTAARYLSDIRKELSAGVSLCIVMTDPDGPYNFQRALKYDLEMAENLTTCSLDLSSLEEVSLSSFQKAVVGESESANLGDFIRNEAPDIILLHGFENVKVAMRKDIVVFVRRWAENCHTSGDVKSLCLFVPGNRTDEIRDIRSSTTSSRINVRCLAGMPSALDVQLLSRTHFSGEFFSAESHWRELIISSLSGNDLELASLLGHSSLDTYDNINNALQDYASLNSWNRVDLEKNLQNWTPLTGSINPDTPKHAENIKLMWMKIVVYTLEHGEEIHPAALALLGRDDEIKRRIWRAQMTLALPIIDEIRIKIYFLLKDKLSNTWGHDDIPEIGEIKYSIEKLSIHSWEWKQYYETVRYAREVRNKLAHMGMITLRDYEYVWNSWQRIRNSGKARVI